MEFVGDAIKDFHLQSGSSEQQVVALGIATWGIVDNRDSLIPEDVREQRMFALKKTATALSFYLCVSIFFS